MSNNKFAIHLIETAIKSLKSLIKNDLKRILAKIELLGDNPHIAMNVKKLVDYDISYRLSIGNYCVLY